MKASRQIVAIDLGAKSGRIIFCRWDGEKGELCELHRFQNGAREEDGHLVWDLEAIWEEILKGLWFQDGNERIFVLYFVDSK